MIKQFAITTAGGIVAGIVVSLVMRRYISNQPQGIYA